MTVRYATLCSGIESASVAAEPLGWEPAWFSEIEPFPCALLATRFPAVPNMGDMRQVSALMRAGFLEAPPVVVAGTPCQAFSVAGARQGLADPRGALTLSFVDTLDAIDEQRGLDNECVALWENVPGVLSSKDNAFGCFLGALAGENDALVPPGGKWTNAGYVLGPRRSIAWRVLDAQYFGLAQRRRRVFVVASARTGFDPAAVLFESEGVRRDTPPRREAGQSLTACLDASFGRLQGCSGQDANHGHSHLVALGGNNTSGPIDVAPARNACSSSSDRLDFESEAFVVAFHHNAQAAQLPTASRDTGVADALTCSQGAAAAIGRSVRRLTPRECERLQGFPDDWTLIPWRGKPAEDCPDGPRYKAIGNSKAVPVVRWILNRIDCALRALEDRTVIYVTPYDPATLRCTGPSVPSGFDSLDDVPAIMGPCPCPGRRVLTYPDVAFSDFVLHVDAAVTSGLPCQPSTPEQSGTL